MMIVDEGPLTFDFFMGLETGHFLVSDLCRIYPRRTCPQLAPWYARPVASWPDRPAQWQAIQTAGADGRPCRVFVSRRFWFEFIRFTTLPLSLETPT